MLVFLHFSFCFQDESVSIQDEPVDYLENNIQNINRQNKKISDKFMDEPNCAVITDLVGLRSEASIKRKKIIYSDDDDDENKAHTSKIHKN